MQAFSMIRLKITTIILHYSNYIYLLSIPNIISLRLYISSICDAESHHAINNVTAIRSFTHNISNRDWIFVNGIVLIYVGIWFLSAKTREIWTCLQDACAGEANNSSVGQWEYRQNSQERGNSAYNGMAHISEGNYGSRWTRYVNQKITLC